MHYRIRAYRGIVDTESELLWNMKPVNNFINIFAYRCAGLFMTVASGINQMVTTI